MKKYLFILTAYVLILLPSMAESKNDLALPKNIEEELLNLRDPFIPQLPEEKKEIQITQPILPSKVEIPTRPIDREAPQLAPVPVPEQPLPNLTISGLIWNTDRPQAIVNNQIVDIGDHVSDVEVVAINKMGIDVTFNGKTVTIKP